jgi:hypothetical protein
VLNPNSLSANDPQTNCDAMFSPGQGRKREPNRVKCAHALDMALLRPSPAGQIYIRARAATLQQIVQRRI